MIGRKPPSLIRLIDTDYITLLALVFPLVAWGLYAAFKLTRAASPPDAIYIPLAAAVTAAALAVLVWRYRAFAHVFAEGVEVRAVIHTAAFFRDRGRLEFVYTYLGEKYLGSTAVHKNARTKVLQPGEQVTVLVDPGNPRRAFIRDLYVL